jgi:prevent-host-death family protein
MSNNHVVSAAEANRAFSRLLRLAAGGARVTITSHGRPVATLGPPAPADAADRRAAALADLEAHWQAAEPMVVGPWSRDDLYAR